MSSLEKLFVALDKDQDFMQLTTDFLAERMALIHELIEEKQLPALKELQREDGVNLQRLKDELSKISLSITNLKKIQSYNF